MELIVTLYETSSRASCAQVLSSAHVRLAGIDLIKISLALCQCPATFKLLEEAQDWTKRIPPDKLGFSKPMAADALLIAAQAAEWNGDWEKMLEHSDAAVALEPNHPTAKYWLVRARLHRPGSQPLDGVDETAFSRLPQSPRLRLQVRLHQQPTLDSAEQLLALLQDKQPNGDLPEAALNLRLLEDTLTSDDARKTENLRRCATLSVAVAKCAGPQPWVETNCALAEIQLDRQYATAALRLDRKHLWESPSICLLLHIARLLAGQPAHPVVQIKDDTVSVLTQSFQKAVGGCNQPIDPRLLANIRAKGSDPLLLRFPALQTTFELLRFAVEAATGVVRRDELLAYAIPIDAPVWANWLQARVALAGAGFAEVENGLNTMVVRDQATAKFVDAWWQNYSRPGRVLPNAIKTAKSLLIPRSPTQAFAALGAVCEAVCAFETEWLKAFYRGRARLSGEPRTTALADFRRIQSQLETSSPLVLRAWQPLIRYWIAVASARDGEKKAFRLLEESAAGPLAGEARAQLLLLALQERDTDAARRWLVDLPDDFPAALYARAVWHAHRKEPVEALCWLSEYAARFGTVPSPYAQAARRLRAAVAERTSDPEAENLCAAVLHDYPEDAVAAARLARIRLQRVYRDTSDGNPSTGAPLAGLFATAARPAVPSLAWSLRHELLHRILCCSEGELDKMREILAQPALVGSSSLPWRQILSRRWLQARRPDEAWTLLSEVRVSAGPRWYDRAYFVLRSWDTIRKVAKTAKTGKDDAKKLAVQVQELREYSAQNNDPLVRRWEWLLEKASTLAQSPATSIASIPWGELAPWAFAHTPSFWAADPQQRARAAVGVEDAVSADSVGWTDEQRRVLLALVAWEKGDDHAFLEQYATIEPSLGLLPVEGTAMWLAAAEICFKRRNWKRLLGSDMPECVADLSHPRVRMVIGLAYAQSAVEDAQRGDTRSAQQKVRQAGDTLQYLAPTKRE